MHCINLISNIIFIKIISKFKIYYSIYNKINMFKNQTIL